MVRVVFSIVFFLAVLLDLFVACGSAAKKENSATNDSSTIGMNSGPDLTGAPKWVTKGLPGFFCGIGVSKVINQSDVALKIARKYSIYSIAAHVKTQISRCFEDSRIEYGDLTDEVIQQLVNTSVSFSSSKGVWWTPKKDYVFLIRCIEPEEFEKIFTDWINENGMQMGKDANSKIYKDLENNINKYLAD